MSSADWTIRRMGDDDARCGFQSGTPALDEYFRRYALANDRADIGRAYVLSTPSEMSTPGLPSVLGFYTLSMASVSSEDATSVLAKKLPRYPMPVALIGRLAVDHRARGRRLGEALLLDALRRIVDAAGVVACLGVIVDAKNEGAERFYAHYDFVTVDSAVWPRRMFLPLSVVRAAFSAS